MSIRKNRVDKSEYNTECRVSHSYSLLRTRTQLCCPDIRRSWRSRYRASELAVGLAMAPMWRARQDPVRTLPSGTQSHRRSANQSATGHERQDRQRSRTHQNQGTKEPSKEPRDYSVRVEYGARSPGRGKELLRSSRSATEAKIPAVGYLPVTWRISGSIGCAFRASLVTLDVKTNTSCTASFRAVTEETCRHFSQASSRICNAYSDARLSYESDA